MIHGRNSVYGVPVLYLKGINNTRVVRKQNQPAGAEGSRLFWRLDSQNANPSLHSESANHRPRPASTAQGIAATGYGRTPHELASLPAQSMDIPVRLENAIKSKRYASSMAWQLRGATSTSERYASDDGISRRAKIAKKPATGGLFRIPGGFIRFHCLPRMTGIQAVRQCRPRTFRTAAPTHTAEPAGYVNGMGDTSR